jgi:hypothetical protein
MHHWFLETIAQQHYYLNIIYNMNTSKLIEAAWINENHLPNAINPQTIINTCPNKSPSPLKSSTPKRSARSSAENREPLGKRGCEAVQWAIAESFP